jgi:hypothetical protein
MKRIIKTIATYLAGKDVIRKAIAEGGDFRVYTNRPTPRVMVGIFLMFFSYVIGWPLIGALGWLAFHTGLPLIVMVGGPVAYALSNVVFMIGAYLAGKDYAKALTKWLIKRLFEKILGPQDAANLGRLDDGKG